MAKLTEYQRAKRDLKEQRRAIAELRHTLSVARSKLLADSNKLELLLHEREYWRQRLLDAANK